MTEVPTNHRFTVRARLDDEVHLLNAPLDAVVRPLAYTTHCGRAVVEVCRDGRPATCAACMRSADRPAASTEVSDAGRPRGECVR
jgi:hypothetical protein